LEKLHIKGFFTLLKQLNNNQYGFRLKTFKKSITRAGNTRGKAQWCTLPGGIVPIKGISSDLGEGALCLMGVLCPSLL